MRKIAEMTQENSNSAEMAEPKRPSSARRLKDTVAQSSIALRQSVLNGNFYSSTVPSDQWSSPSFKMLVFVSSTFTDTQLERDYLMDELLFLLRERAHQYNVQVIFADMRWGIRDENTKDHRTWIECANGINWCKQQSLGVCFLSLQGDKYGYTPLPKSILKTDLDQHVASTECDQETKELIFKWYQLDENAVPNEYVLRNLSDINDSEF